MITLDEDNFDAVTGTGTVVIDFYADWCRSCHLMEPVLEALEKDMPHVTFAKLNSSDCPTVCRNCKIGAIPTTLIYKGGKEVARAIGMCSEEQMKEIIDSV